MDGVPHDAVSEQRYVGPAIYHVTGAARNLVDVKLEASVFEDPYRAAAVEFTRTSLSLAAVASPRATELNTAAWATPNRRKSPSSARSFARVSSSE